MRSYIIHFILLFLPLGANAGESNRQVWLMGTWLFTEVSAEDQKAADSVSETLIRTVEHCESLLSTWNPESELALINARGLPSKQGLSLSPCLAKWLGQARKWAERSDGAFNPAVGPLISCWDLRGEGKIPSGDEIRRAVALASPDKWQLKEETLFSSQGLRFDAGGFGKGAALDAALATVNGEANVRLNFGGQWASRESFEVEIAHPEHRDRAILKVLMPNGGSVATSGNSERSFVIDGKRYGHLLDPRTGVPAEDCGSVTVVARDAFTADCVSTAGYVMGPEKFLAWVETLDGVEGLIVQPIENTVQVRASSGLRTRLSARDAGLTIDFYSPLKTKRVTIK